MKNATELIYYSSKAPSGHNSQPWRFRIQENSIEIHPDFDCTLPVVDPKNRELYISLGCAAENLCVASIAYGYHASWQIDKDSNESHIIRIHLNTSNKKTRKDILGDIQKRQTNRSVYKGTIVQNSILNQLRELPTEENVRMHFFKNGDSSFSSLTDLIKKGNEIQMNDERFKNELLSWIRLNKRQVEKTNSGLSHKVMQAPSMPGFIGKRIVRSFLTPAKQNKSDREKIKSSSHFILLTTKNNCPEEWIRSGLFLERLLIKLTSLGIASAFINPPCELESLSGELQKTLPINDEVPTLILRIGYADRMPSSPRKTVENVIDITQTPSAPRRAS